MIGLIVDGEGDYAGFRARYSGLMRVMKTEGPRGHTVSNQALVSSAKRQILQLKALGCSPIAVLTDFEGRSGSCEKFCEDLRKRALVLFGVEILFFSPNQMLENWLLADISALSHKKTYLKRVKAQKSFEAKHGKQELKKMFVTGIDYHEIRHSAELFPLVSGERASRFSESFAKFRGDLKLAC